MQKQRERREFRLHKDILWSIIQSQAGTLQKAVLELVMNSIDAGSSEVRIAFSGKRVEVSDDGKGFASRQEIEDFFETFGTPHKEGDARYGKFRMGRGQIMAFSRNRWRSGCFQMAVDIKDMGLEYDLAELTESAPGCRIEADLYTPLSPSETIRTSDSLRELCKYAPIPVYLNNERISLDLTREKWTHEDEDAYYLIRPNSSRLDVYNLGVHVTGYPSGVSGIGGVFVSKVALQINFARNDILVNSCEVWKRALTKLRAFAKQHEEKAPTQNEAYRTTMMERLLSGGFDSGKELFDALSDAKVFTTLGGKHLSLFGLSREVESCCGRLVELGDNHAKADRVHQQKLACVLAPRTRERIRWMSIKDLIERIQQTANGLDDLTFHRRTQIQTALSQLLEALVDIEVVAKSIGDEHAIVEDKELSKAERVVLKAIRAVSFYIAREAGVSDRTIRVCESDTVDGYTDGSSVVFIDRKFLTIQGYMGGVFTSFHAIGELLLHEFLHDNDSGTGHGHPQEFYQAFHDHAKVIGEFAYNAVRLYVSERRRAGMPLRSGEAHAMDMLALQEAA